MIDRLRAPVATRARRKRRRIRSGANVMLLCCKRAHRQGQHGHAQLAWHAQPRHAYGPCRLAACVGMRLRCGRERRAERSRVNVGGHVRAWLRSVYVRGLTDRQ